MPQLIAIIDKNDQLTGELSTPDDATNRGLWHRGAHVIILTPTNRILVQRRSLTSIQHPGSLDIGVGGFVDNGETPEQAVIRETKEETGLIISHDQLVFLGTTRYNHHWHFQKKQKISRGIIYNYAVHLPYEFNHITCQLDEVSWIGFIPLKSGQWLITHRKLKKIGKLLPIYAYYRKLLKQAVQSTTARE